MFRKTELITQMEKTLKIGGIVLGAFLIGFLLWGAIAQIDTAAVAPGTVIVDTYPKNVQHLEGGIIDKIYVHDGSEVKEGDPLIALQQTQASTRAELLSDRYFSLLAYEARLIAERDRLNTFTAPKELLDEAKQDEQVKKAIDMQHQEFKTRKEQLEGVHSILKQRISQLNNEVKSLESQVTSSDTQLSLINKELEAVQQMADQKYVPLSDLYALQREAARLKGDRDQRLAQIAQAKQRIGETELQIIQNDTDTHTEVLAELRKTQDSLAEIEEQMRAANDILDRTIITAPRAGKIINLQAHTIGGVVSPGQTILTIVPKQDKLVVEAHISPLDIDVVEVGLPVKVQLSAFQTRVTPTLDGKVIRVSGDAIQQPQTNEYYYLARVQIDAKSLSENERLALYPGMPVQVMIIVNRDSFLNYLLRPVVNSLGRAFKEQ